MARRKWLSRRRSADTGIEPAGGAQPPAPPGDVPADPPPAPSLAGADDAVLPPVAPVDPFAAAPAPAPTGPALDAGDAEAERSPLAQGRYERLVAAAGVAPLHDLSPHARSVLDWISRQDDAVCSGVVELLQATSLATARHIEEAGRA